MEQEILHKLLEHNYCATIKNGRIITNHKINDITFQLSADLSDGFPLTLPRMYLLNKSKYGLLAHIECRNDSDDDMGAICKGVPINRNIDYSDPFSVFKKALDTNANLIKKLLSDDDYNKQQIINEFIGHWKNVVKNSAFVISFLEPSQDIIELNPYLLRGKYPCFIKDSMTDINPEYGFYKLYSKNSILNGKGIYIPFDFGIMPPNINQDIVEWWQKTIGLLTPVMTKKIARYARRHKTKLFWVISSVKIDDNKYSWFAIKFKSRDKIAPPISAKSDFNAWKATPYKVNIHNQNYMLPRGGAETNLGDKTIAIIGCGSVGGEVAVQLASIGVKNIVLIDYDLYSIENIYRHVLPSYYIDNSKSKSLAKHLNSIYPYVKAKASKIKYLKDCISDEFLSSIDGIIVATGNPTEERYFNDHIIQKEKHPWVIYTWTEGLGIGGHAIYVHNSGKGCLNCLYRDHEGNKSLKSINNFIEADQDIAVDISGCGTHFLPYTNIDAIQTAILATRLMLNATFGQIDESCKISWKNHLFAKDEINSSYKFKNYNNSLKIEKLYWKDCDICN